MAFVKTKSFYWVDMNDEIGIHPTKCRGKIGPFAHSLHVSNVLLSPFHYLCCSYMILKYVLISIFSGSKMSRSIHMHFNPSTLHYGQTYAVISVNRTSLFS